MPRKRESAAVLAGTRGAGDTETQRSEKPTASAGGRVARFALVTRGGYPFLRSVVFAIYPNAHPAEDLARRLRANRCDAWVEPAQPGDYPGRIRPEGAR